VIEMPNYHEIKKESNQTKTKEGAVFRREAPVGGVERGAGKKGQRRVKKEKKSSPQVRARLS